MPREVTEEQRGVLARLHWRKLVDGAMWQQAMIGTEQKQFMLIIFHRWANAKLLEEIVAARRLREAR